MMEKPSWSFYVGWIVLNFITIVVAWFLTWALVHLIINVMGVDRESRVVEDFLYVYLLFPTIGLSTGSLQYLLLRYYLPHMAWWIVATCLGWLLPFVVGAMLTALSTPMKRIFWVLPFVLGDLLTGLFSLSNSRFLVMVGLALIGVSIALPQWWMLRNRVQHAGWWILAYASGWLLIGFLNTWPSVHSIVLMEISLIPTITTSVACWFLLGWSPRRELKSIISGDC